MRSKPREKWNRNWVCLERIGPQIHTSLQLFYGCSGPICSIPVLFNPHFIITHRSFSTHHTSFRMNVELCILSQSRMYFGRSTYVFLFFQFMRFFRYNRLPLLLLAFLYGFEIEFTSILFELTCLDNQEFSKWLNSCTTTSLIVPYCITFIMTKVFVRDETTDKIPMKFMVIIGLCAFLDFFCLNQVIPNVPFMIADYFPNVKTAL